MIHPRMGRQQTDTSVCCRNRRVRAGLRFSDSRFYGLLYTLQDVPLEFGHALLFQYSAYQTRRQRRFVWEMPCDGLAICSERADCSVRSLVFGKVFERVGRAPSL